MTTEQLFLILGTIYIAPHIHCNQGFVVGFGFLIAAVCKSLELI